MKKEYLAFLSVSMIFLLFLIPFVVSDTENLNKINKNVTLNNPSYNISKYIHGADYNITKEQKNIPGITEKVYNYSVINLSDSNFNLNQVQEIGNNKEKIFSYEQEYKGIPVFGGSLNLVKNKNNNIIATKENYYRGININVKKILSNEQVNEIIGENLNLTLKSHFNNITFKDINFTKINETTVILPIEVNGDIKYKLAQKIDLPISKYPLSSWTYFIDAKSGELIKKINKIVSVDANGYISGDIYSENPNETAQNRYFSNNYIALQKEVNRSIYSGSGDDLDNIMTTKENINLSNSTSVTLSFSTSYEIESNYDFAYIWVSDDGGSTWDYPPLKSYTGSQPEWINESINISKYAGKNILLALEYVTDAHLSLGGLYLDNLKINSSDGIKFQDDFENGTDKWNVTGFSIARSYALVNFTYSDKNGFYSLKGEEANSTLYSYLSGQFANVINMGNQSDIFYDKDINNPGTYNLSWSNYDSSYKKEESNIFYHVNIVHDFFTKGAPFDIYEMNYQTKAIYNLIYPEPFTTYCNAFSDGEGIYFFPKLAGKCDALTLYSDVTYHEYTHNVVKKVYGSTPFPYENESGAMNEGWADYFAGTINNNSCMAEDFGGAPCLRNLSNSNKYPYNVTNEVHNDSAIFSGSLWDLRSKVGAGLADNLTMEAMKLKAQDFFEYLDDMLFVDNNYTIPSNGTTNWHAICSSFSKHGITSDFCSPIITNYNQTSEIEEGEIKNISIYWENPIASTNTTIYYCNSSFSNCSYYNYENSTEMQSGPDGSYSANISINKEGTWKFFVYTLSDDVNYTSNTYNISVSLHTICGDSICNGVESCSSCPSDCGICEVTSSGGGGGSIKPPQEWTSTQIIAESQIKNSYTQELGKNQMIKFPLYNQDHHIGIKGIDENSIIIELASDPQNITFLIGETKKFNLTSDNHYDLQITLNDLKNKKANLTITEIYEEIEKSSPKNNEMPTDNNNENNGNASFPSTPEKDNINYTLIYFLIALIIIILAIITVYNFYRFHHHMKKHRKDKKYHIKLKSV